MEVAITLLVPILTAVLTIGGIHWIFRKKQFHDNLEDSSRRRTEDILLHPPTLRDMVKKVPLPPRRSTVDVMANPRPLPGTLRINIHPAEGVPGEWIADVQPVDIITQGRDMVHAIEAAAEAVQMCWEDDQANGLNFWDRGRTRRELEACTPDNPCLNTKLCPHCKTFPSGSGG